VVNSHIQKHVPKPAVPAFRFMVKALFPETLKGR
jgi:hypothetical protein